MWWYAGGAIPFCGATPEEMKCPNVKTSMTTTEVPGTTVLPSSSLTKETSKEEVTTSSSTTPIPSSSGHAQEVPGGFNEYQNGAVGTLPKPCGGAGAETFCSR